MLYLEIVKSESHYFSTLCGGVTNYFPMKASTLQNENAFTSMALVVEYSGAPPKGLPKEFFDGIVQQ